MGFLDPKSDKKGVKRRGQKGGQKLGPKRGQKRGKNTPKTGQKLISLDFPKKTAKSANLSHFRPKTAYFERLSSKIPETSGKNRVILTVFGTKALETRPKQGFLGHFKRKSLRKALENRGKQGLLGHFGTKAWEKPGKSLANQVKARLSGNSVPKALKFNYKRDLFFYSTAKSITKIKTSNFYRKRA